MTVLAVGAPSSNRLVLPQWREEATGPLEPGRGGAWRLDSEVEPASSGEEGARAGGWKKSEGRTVAVVDGREERLVGTNDDASG